MGNMYNNSLNNNIVKMFNTNRNYINQEINRLAITSQRSVEYRRKGTIDSGASQMKNFINFNNMIVGTSNSSPIVGE